LLLVFACVGVGVFSLCKKDKIALMSPRNTCNTIGARLSIGVERSSRVSKKFTKPLPSTGHLSARRTDKNNKSYQKVDFSVTLAHLSKMPEEPERVSVEGPTRVSGGASLVVQQM